MIIGVFRGVEGGCDGSIRTLVLHCPQVVVLPDKDDADKFRVMQLGRKGKHEDVELGIARRRCASNSVFVQFVLDCPSLNGPMVATMFVGASGHGPFSLEWLRA